MKEAGIGTVRMDFLWNDVQPAADRFAWERYDAIVTALEKQKIAVLGILCYNADWTGCKWNQAPDRPRFVEYARATARRYQGRVGHWEVWNEPDTAAYWEQQDGLKEYALLLKETAAIVRKEAPGAKVLNGGLADARADGLDRLYRLAGKEAFGIVAIHPFVDPLQADPVAALKAIVDKTRATMKAHGDESKAIWLTEVGCPGMKDPAASKAWWLGRNPDEAEQARWVERLTGEPLKWPGVKRVFWAFFRDTPQHFYNGSDFLGLVRRDFTPKPAYEAFRKAAKR